MSQNIGKLILRFSIGFLLLFHGVHKLKYGVAYITKLLESQHIITWLAYGSYIIEIIAALFLIIGWKSRIWASLIALYMLVAIYLTKYSHLFSLSTNGALSIEREVLFFMGAFTIVLLGSGRYAIHQD